ncbi:glycoside hydrolase [Butyrivibrio sp. CB08]|uniref:family 43 glycosylhydrolase n=1 Tax=Butyrivibrio sp. CB08 TaxID=2364879 RepID=UPI000EA88275|nr:family 43 glycosylhydrolase [Butyrivibrio sp. CB08]RKM55373.1 glycoside hydrolase [Butyrivibrio sp. CB08]
MDEITLILAIKENDLKTVEHILVQDPALVSKEALFCAAREGHMDILKYLVEYSRVSLNEYDDEHRNVLHYGAESGDLEVFRYLVEKCGMDPLVGDKNLETPWDLVHKRHSEIEQYLESRYAHKYEDFYRNPIRTGFFPDPSICRVGEDYYMVNSSFIFFPCIPISHSRDLIHWEIIGHAITNPEWAHLDELEGGRGYWAPDISFYKGRFYITATYRLNDVPPTYRRQIVVSSDKPEGPYSEPVFIDEDGIDPSIFNDDDGKRYMLLNRGARIFELDESGTKKISDAQLLFYGDHKRAPEGPHLYKKDGYYYLLEAEGGTGPGHRVTVSRAKELFGNYEPCPYNPIMRQNDPDAGIQRCGHGDLVETQDGRWYMVYLCGRMIGDGYSLLGRETAIDPVTWTPDGWPIVNGLKGPSTMQVKPFAGAGTATEKTGISPCGLPFDYMTPRPFTPGGVKFSPETGRFEISGSKAPLSSVDSRNIVLKRQTSFEFQYAATLEIPAMTEGQTAGITGYYDENTFFEFGITSRGGQIYLYSNEHVGDDDRTKISDEPVPANVTSIRLIMDTSYLTRRLSYQYNAENGSETEFITLDNVCYLCDEGLKKGKRFTGAMVGMYSYASESDLTAVFHSSTHINRYLK